MGYSSPSGILGVLPLLSIAEALKEAWKREARRKVMNMRGNGSTDNLDDAFSFCF
jgi:hypothetical protein